MDFFQIHTKEVKGKEGVLEVYPDFVVGRSEDLMVRGRAFYAIWNPGIGLWSTDEYDVQALVDHELKQFAEKLDAQTSVKYMRNYGSNGWNQFRRFMSQISDNSHQLDENLTFANTQVKKTDYVSRRLPYALAPGDHSAWDELIGTLYSPEERAKIEWAIGAVVSGDSKKIQKFLVLYGPAGTGKSTVLNIIQKLFDGYATSFEAKALGGTSNAFATEAFRSNPLVAIQHDGDLSRIEDNTKLNSLVSHELMTFNEKYKPSYTQKSNALLLMGTNQPVKISDAKSGLIRRLIDVHPTGEKIPPNHYHALMARIEFELGAIAHHCLEVYRSMGKNYYNNYQPLEMMLQTDVFFNFIEYNYDLFKAQDGCTLKQAYALYKEFCTDTGVERMLPQYKVREELRNYFEEFHDRKTVGGESLRSYYSGFKAMAFKTPVKDDGKIFSLVMDDTTSIFDLEYAELPAQLAKEDETPKHRWSDVKTTLAEIDTSNVHYVKVPENHIVIDFDLKDESGGKSLERNLAAASEWPATYAELSKSGKGVHLHYIWTGSDPSELHSNYSDEGIEVKVFAGNASLRRRLVKCNNVPIAELNSGLPLKEKKVLQVDQIKTQKGLRDLIARNLRKEIHPGTKPSIDFIKHILDEAYESGMAYDLTDLKSRIIAFANSSTNQSLACLKAVQQMKFVGAEVESKPVIEETRDERLVFFDVEVFPNLFIVCWKYQGDSNVVRMINPTPEEIEPLFKMRLIGFNNRRYDNHILWAAFLGYTNEQLYNLSVKIINSNVGSMFGEAFNLSWTDIYDFSSVKKGLKKFQIDLGIRHKELDHPWDLPIPESRWKEATDYCANDVVSTEKVFESRHGDYTARLILAELSGLSPNDTTAKHTAKIIFGSDPNPQRNFVYTNLSKEFPGYVFEAGKSYYRGELVGEGGYVHAEPGMYENVALLDVASMHPTSITILNLFGDYTKNFTELVEARLAIKAEELERARNLLGGKLAKYIGADADDTKALAYALKIVVNIVYGLTSAKFDNAFRDIRNVDNIVAKRGALFMIDLKHFIREQGFEVAHIKTDSVKIPNATPEIIEAVKRFGEKYGYTFEYNPEKDFYDKFCLVNDAVYIARIDECITPHWIVVDESTGETQNNDISVGTINKTTWYAVGAQFQHPYVFKSLFTKEPITFDDLCETKQVVQGAMYLDFENQNKSELDVEKMHFIGRTGRFVPVKDEQQGGTLYRIKDGKPYAVAGTKGYLWAEAEVIRELGIDAVDMRHFDTLVEQAIATIDYFGPFNTFVG